MNCKTMKDYMLIDLKTDVLVSLDVFERNRDQFLEYYEIDSCNTDSSPGLT